MKKFYSLFFLLSALLLSSHLKANEVTVKGRIKFANGSPAKNVLIDIATNVSSANTTCTAQTTTNDEGFYTKVLSCNGDIKTVKISVKNCDGQILFEYKEVPASKVIEQNFTLCSPPSTVCKANFTFELTAAGVKFNSNISTSSPNDAIETRSWNFGDGSPILNGNVDPLHTFPHPGTYTVCLTTKTHSGCESKECKQVVIPEPPKPVVCTARFTFEHLGPKKFRFNSGTSVIGANDTIVQRQWEFRDGTSASTEIAPAHEFAKPGTYEVCLTIKTAKGCQSKFCLVVKAEEAAPTTDNTPIKIISLYPTPVHTELKTLLYSKNSNTIATIAIVNVYGETKWSKQVTLTQGNNPFEIPVSNLLPGPYFFRIISAYGVLSKTFYKL